MYYYLYDWVFYKSETPRRLLWQHLYDSLCWLYPQTRWKVMNYGFALLNDDGKLITNLKPEDEEERFCLQLYHYIATSDNFSLFIYFSNENSLFLYYLILF